MAGPNGPSGTMMPPTDVQIEMQSGRGQEDGDELVEIEASDDEGGEGSGGDRGVGGGDGRGSGLGTGASAAEVERIRLLEENLERLRTEMAQKEETYQKRLSDTQAWAHQRNQEATLAQQLLEASRVARQEAEFKERQRAALAAPDWSPDERDVVGGVLDPDVLLRKMMETSTWGARQALNEVAPYVQTFNNAAQQLPYMQALQSRLFERERERALADALADIETRGEMSNEEAEAVVPEVYRAFYERGGPQGAAIASLDPSTISTAILLEHRRRGGAAPVKTKSPKPRSLGSSTPRASNKVTVSREVAEAAREAERVLGVKFGADDYATMVAPSRAARAPR